VEGSVYGYYHPAAQGVQNHICVLPCGGIFEHPIYKWTVSDLKYYVKYHAGDQPVDSMFNGFVFKGYSVEKGRYMHPLHAAFGQQGNRQDWEQWTESLFAPDTNLKALYALADDSPLDVWVSIPYPFIDDKGFGELHGSALYFDTTERRFAAISWWIDQFIARWHAESYLSQKLHFRGFLWQRESINEYDDELVKRTNAYIRTKGFLSLWLPYYASYGTTNWKDFNFDVAAYHTNYYGNTMYDYQWVNAVSYSASYYNTGIQMIYGKGPIYNGTHHLDHFNLGLPEYQGYMKHSFIVYQFPNQTMKTIYSENIVDYIRIYMFIKGLYTKIPYPNMVY